MRSRRMSKLNMQDYATVRLAEQPPPDPTRFPLSVADSIQSAPLRVNSKIVSRRFLLNVNHFDAISEQFTIRLRKTRDRYVKVHIG